jgi:hypothetical protein
MLESLSVLLLTAASLGGTAPPDSIEGAHTTLDFERGCTVLDRVPEGEPGSWVRMVCVGYRGYPVFYREGDLRVSLAYGFPGADGEGPGWESFASFNHPDSIVEWRREMAETSTRPFAAIQRWYVYAGGGGGHGEEDREVLVVNRVAQPDDGAGCVVGYVDAEANQQPGELARRVADEVARRFRCGTDEPGYHGETTEATPRPSRSGGG